MDSALSTVGLPVALGIIMFGLGLGLTPGDFSRVGKHPRAVLVALGCQLLPLPTICFGLVLLFDLPPLFGIGMMLLATSPGGTTAHLYSHLFHGDVALNITHRSPGFAARMDKPVRIASAIILAVLVLAILLGELDEVAALWGVFVSQRVGAAEAARTSA